MLPLLDHPALLIQAIVARALGDLRDPRAVAPLLAKLPVDDVFIHTSVVAALGAIGDVRALVPLIGLIRARAAVLPPHDRLRAVSQALCALGPPAIGAMLPLLDDADADVRWVAVTAVGCLQAAQALPQLEQRARSDTGKTSAGASLQAAAARAMRRITRPPRP